MHPTIRKVTEIIKERSTKSRAHYLQAIKKQQVDGVQRQTLACSNLAHGFAACSQHEKAILKNKQQPNIAIVSAYNDLLSAHQPYEHYPRLIKKAVQQAGGVAQFAGGVPAMCDGITQGMPGMELSLLSRDVIALATAIALSHNLFDGGLLLGICDKIVPGLLIGALRFGHLPFIFIPAGPMPSGISNTEKAKIRQLFAEQRVGAEELLEAEAASYHAPGTCTFYGTANSNQLLIELMGLQLPGSSFVNPGTDLRNSLTEAASQQIVNLTALGNNYLPLAEIVTVETIVNAIVGLLATGGSTNHTIHLVAIARAAGILINWDDFATISQVTPLIAKIYPNGTADINHFQQAGGMSFLIHHLLAAGLLHADVKTICGAGLDLYTKVPQFNGQLSWTGASIDSRNENVLRSPDQPFKKQGGLTVLKGNLGRAIFKNSALTVQQEYIHAPAAVFNNQEELVDAFKRGELDRDCIVVIRFQGPKACGMPELHKLTAPLGVLQDKGFKVALVTDGRMSGASGKVPAAIHVSPEAVDGGLLAKINNGDWIKIDAINGILELCVASAELVLREKARCQQNGTEGFGVGRELFGILRQNFSLAEEGACSLFSDMEKLNA